MYRQNNAQGMSWEQVRNMFTHYLGYQTGGPEFNAVNVMNIHNPRRPDQGQSKYESYEFDVWPIKDAEFNWISTQIHLIEKRENWVKERHFYKMLSSGEQQTAYLMAESWDCPEKQMMILLKAHLFEACGGRNGFCDGYGNGISRGVHRILSQAIESAEVGLMGHRIEWHRLCCTVLSQPIRNFEPKIDDVYQALQYFADKTNNILSQYKFVRLQYSPEIDETFEFRVEHYLRMKDAEKKLASRIKLLKQEKYTAREEVDATDTSQQNKTEDANVAPDQASPALKEAIQSQLSTLEDLGGVNDSYPAPKKEPESRSSKVATEAEKDSFSNLRREVNSKDFDATSARRPDLAAGGIAESRRVRSVTEILLESAALRNRPVSQRVNDAMQDVGLDALEKMIWSEPMTKVCTRFGINSSELSAYCKENGLSTPTSLFWGDVSRGILAPNGLVSTDVKYFTAPKKLPQKPSSSGLGI